MARATLRTTDHDGNDQSFDLEVGDNNQDVDPSDQVDRIEEYAETREEAVRADLQADIEDTEEELEDMRDLVVSEIVRRQKLAGEIGEDQDLSVDDQREYLEGLPAERLQMEWERAPDTEDLSGSTETVTTGDDPEGATTDLDAAADKLS